MSRSATAGKSAELGAAAHAPGASEPGLVPRGGLGPVCGCVGSIIRIEAINIMIWQHAGSLLTSLLVGLPSWQDDREGRCAPVQKLSQYNVALPLFVRRNDGLVV